MTQHSSQQAPNGGQKPRAETPPRNGQNGGGQAAVPQNARRNGDNHGQAGAPQGNEENGDAFSKKAFWNEYKEERRRERAAAAKANGQPEPNDEPAAEHPEAEAMMAAAAEREERAAEERALLKVEQRPAAEFHHDESLMSASALFLPRDAKGRVARIKVVGVGGGGSNSVESMLRMGLDGVEFLVVNTDVQALASSSCPLRLQIGADITSGLGAGADPEVGRLAAESSRAALEAFFEGADMVFVTAGMGGGTGTGAAPVVASIAREMGILCAAICTKPFQFEGARRAARALEGLERMRDAADTMIVIANDKLLTAVGPNTPLRDAFQISNNVLGHAVSSISEIVSESGLVNVDFADVRAVLSDAGNAIMGIGKAQGDQRAVNAVRKACQSPLLEKLVIDGAGGILVSIVGGPDLSLHEVSEAIGLVSGAASRDADIIFGACIDESFGEEVKATVLATRFEATPTTELRGGGLVAHAPKTGNAASALLDEIHAHGGHAPHAGNPLASVGEEALSSLDELLGLGAPPAPHGAAGAAKLANGAAGASPAAAADDDDPLADDPEDMELPAYLRRRRKRRFF